MVKCKSKNVYFAMDTTSGYNNDMQIMNNIKNKLEQAGYTVKRMKRGPNELASNYSYCLNNNIHNSIVFNLMNGVDPSNIVEAYQSDKNRGDGFWYSQQALKPLGNVAVLGWFYGSCDAVNEDGECNVKGIRPSETYHSRFYNPAQKMKENGVLALCEKNDYNGDKVAEAFIKLVNENMGEVTPENNDGKQITPEITPSTIDTTKTLSEQVVTEVYTNAYYQKVVTAKTDDKGAFITPLDLQIPGRYVVNINYNGNKYYNGSNTTITIENYKGNVFKHKLLQTTTINKYTDGTSETTTNGDIGNEKHLLTIKKTRTYQNGVLKEEKSEKTTSDGIDIVTPTTITDTTNPSTVIPEGDKKDPFTTYIPVTSAGLPDVANMKHGNNYFSMVDRSKVYTLTKEQYKEVMDRDSKSIQINNYVESKYTAFLSVETPNTYQVIERERWNVIEESIYYYLVKGDGYNYTLDSPNWPEKIIVDFPNRKTTLDGSTINWKAEKCDYWFVADDQDLGYTCGPTACSVCTQVLHKYYSERYMQSLIGAVSGNGSGPTQHQTALQKLGFNAKIYSDIDTAINWLKQNKPCVYHTPNHYICLADVYTGDSNSTSLNCSGIQLSKGSSGNNVEALQKILKDKGYYTGEITSIFDETLENSVKAYQRANNLTVDGWVGSQTCNSLNGGGNGTKILVANSVTQDGYYGPLTGWRSRSTLKDKNAGSAVLIELSWTLSEEEKGNLNNFYKSMGGAWSKPANTNESLRMYILRYK